MVIFRQLWKFIILILLVLLSTSSNGIAERIIKEIVVCQGQDAYFIHASQHQIRYVQFGEKKEGEMGPDPLVIRVNKQNKPYEVCQTTYSARLMYGGRIKNGSLVFILHNAQVNDSRTFLAYLKEVGNRAMYTVEFKLQVKDNCTNMATVGNSTKRNLTSNSVKPPLNIPTSIYEAPSTDPNVTVAVDPTDTSLSDITVISIVTVAVGAPLVVLVIVVKRLYKPQPHNNADNKSDDYKLEEGNQFPTDDNTTTCTTANELSEVEPLMNQETDDNDDLRKNVLDERRLTSAL